MTQKENLKATDLRIGNLLQTTVTKILIKITIDELLEIINEPKDHQLEPIPLTEEWLIKFGFENWGLGTLYINEFESYKRFVLYNVLDGTSNFEVHYIKSTYGNTNHYQYVISCDEDDRINLGEEIKHVHQLQNLYFALTQKELIYE